MASLRLLGVYVVLITVEVVPTLMSLVRVRNDMMLVLDNLEVTLPLVTMLVKAAIFWRNEKVIASVVRTVEDDWMKPKTKEERENMMGKAGVARTIITCGFLMMATTVAVLVVFPCVGLTIRYTTNLTDPGRILPMQTYYVYDVDRSPVFEVLFLGQAVCLILGAFASTGIDNFFGLLVFHAIAQFENLERRLTDLRNGQHFDLELSFCVKEHVRLIRFVQVIESTFHLMLLGLLSYFAVVFCLQGFLIISTLKEGGSLSITRLSLLLSILSNIFIHMLVYCAVGEALVTKCEAIYAAAYDCKWYALNACEARNLITILIRAKTPLYFTAGKMFPMTMSMFCKLVKTSAGYISVLLARKS